MADKHNSLPQSVLLPYKGGSIVNRCGYLYELCPDHPKANSWGYVPQHRLVAERALGRYLQSEELVHHIDGNKLNNAPENLQVVSRREHALLHRAEVRARTLAPLTHELVEKALRETGGLKPAARLLKCSAETLRRRFPDLAKPYCRRSPVRIDDPKVIETVLLYAGDNRYGYREIAKMTGISARTCQRICQRNGFQWVQKTKKGEVHLSYDNRTAQEIIEGNRDVAQKILEYALSQEKTQNDLYQDFGINYVYMKKVLDYYGIEWTHKACHKKSNQIS